eukprot:COSAG05_NODE_5681_length_1116_cov_21.450206_2_plen_93_part_01
MMQVILDLWHSKKSGRKEMQKFVSSEHSQVLAPFVRDIKVAANSRGRVVCYGGLNKCMEAVTKAQVASLREDDFSEYTNAIGGLSADAWKSLA